MRVEAKKQLGMDMLQPNYQNQSQDGSTPRPNFWPQFLLGQGAMVPPGQVPPMVGAQGVFSAPTTTPLARFPSGNVRGSLPAPLLLPVPAQPLHHAQSGGPLLKQMPPVAKPERGMSENLSTKVRKPYTITKQRERWTEAEHERFLEALKLHGRAWRKIEEHIGSKTAVQIRSHAQKFFSKLEREGSTANPTSSAPEIDIPPPRPKRKPSHPYPRKAGGNMSESENEYGPSPRTGARKETYPLDEAMSPNTEPSQSDRSQGFSLWRNGSTPELPNSLLKEAAVLPLTLGCSLSASHPLGAEITDQHNSLKLFGQLLGPATKRGEGPLREDLEKQRVAGKLWAEDARDRHTTPERSFLESGVSSAVIEGDATDSYGPSTSGRGGGPSCSHGKELPRQQSSSHTKDFTFAAPQPKTSAPLALANQRVPAQQQTATFLKPELAYSQDPGPPAFPAPMSASMPAQLAQMFGAGAFGAGAQQWMPFGGRGAWNPAAFEQLAMLAQMNAYGSAGSNPFGPWGAKPAAMWGGFGPGGVAPGVGGGEQKQSAEEAAAESRAAAAAVAAATMAAASAWWTLQNNAAAAAQMGCPPPMPFPSNQFQQQQPGNAPPGQSPGQDYGTPPLLRMPTAHSVQRAAQSEETPMRKNSPARSGKESELEHRGGELRPAHPSASAPQLETEAASSDQRSGGLPSGAAIRRAERANKLRELKGRGGKNGGEMLADSSATPGVYTDSCPYASTQNRRSMESSADKGPAAMLKIGEDNKGGGEERRGKGGDPKEDQHALEVAILKKLKKDERRRDKLRTQSASGSNEPVGGGGECVARQSTEAAPQRGGSPPEVSNSDGGGSGSGKEGSGGPSSNSSAVGDNPNGNQQGRAGSEEGASSEADQDEAPERDGDKGIKKEEEKEEEVGEAQPGSTKQGRAFNELFRQQPLPQSFPPPGGQGTGDSTPGGVAPQAGAKGKMGEGLVRTGSGKHHHHRHHHHAHPPASAATLGSSTAGASSGFLPYKGYQGTFVSITREGSLDSRGREIKHERAEADLPSPAKRQRVQVVAGEGMAKEGQEGWPAKGSQEKRSSPPSGGLSMPMQF